MVEYFFRLSHRVGYPIQKHNESFMLLDRLFTSSLVNKNFVLIILEEKKGVLFLY